MKKSTYRVLLKAATFQGQQSLPTFKLKIGKQADRLVVPFCLPAAEQYYNHELYVERTSETDMTIECLMKEKSIGSGKILFDTPDQKVDILDAKKKKQGSITVQVKKVDKKPKSYAKFKLEVYGGEYPASERKFLVAKIGDTHIKTHVVEGKQPQWNQTFDVKSTEEDTLYLESWAEDLKASHLIGLSTLRLEEAMNAKSTYDVLDAKDTKVGHVLVRLYEDGKGEPGEVVVNDKNILPLKNLKMYILEALLKGDAGKKDTYIKIEAEGQKAQTTTSIFSEARNPKWNQTFQLALKEGGGPIKISLCEKDDKGIEHVIGTSIVDANSIENKQYEIALKTSTNAELGKLYLECDADWIDKKSPRSVVYQEDPEPRSVVKSGVSSYKSANNDNDDLTRRIKEMKDKYSSKTTLHQYFYKELNSVLEEGLLKIAKDKPADPIRELGLFLINYRR